MHTAILSTVFTCIREPERTHTAELITYAWESFGIYNL